jgi:hypothetical protein
MEIEGIKARVKTPSYSVILGISTIEEVGAFLIFLICIVGGGVQTGSTRHVGHLLAYCTCPG